MFSGMFGKYRAIVISVAMFIVLDAGVLVLNFYISSQIAEDAINVNLAGRQRMLSQKMVKSALAFQQSLNDNLPSNESYNELTSAVNLFDKTLMAFKSGGLTQDAKGEPFYLNPVNTVGAVNSVDSALVIWQPLKSQVERLKKLQTSGENQRSVLTSLTQYGQDNNLELLRLMNDLTNELESIARQKSETLRLIQATAITLAVLNFFLILFHFIGQLRRSDALTEEARKETSEILKTVREGLFLIDDQLIIGTQYSASIKDIFGDQHFAGMSFRELLKSLIVDSQMETVEEYIKLLLNGTVKENLIGSLNPLSDIEVSLPDGSGGFDVKHLSFRFNRTIVNKEIRHILITVLDITELVGLRRQLEIATQNHGMQTAALKELLHIDRESLAIFLRESNSALEAVNDILKERANSHSEYREKVNSVFRIIHRLKGDASALNLPNVVQTAHEFEAELETLLDNESLQGGDFLSLTLALNEFFKLLSEMQDIVEILDSMPVVSSEKEDRNGLDKKLITDLAQRIADEHDKKVAVLFNDEAFVELDKSHQKVVQDCVIQLVRNSIVHGIERVQDRQAKGKPAEGSIQINAIQEADKVTISVRDDGDGIRINTIRDKALKRGLYSKEELDSMDPKRLMGMIFEPGFSTYDSVDEHAGRGVGMDIIRSNVYQLKGGLRISNTPSRYCEISLVFPLSERNSKLAVAK
jgi:HPt (histidine-containing phosphotransfer) domain-containing protein